MGYNETFSKDSRKPGFRKARLMTMSLASMTLTDDAGICADLPKSVFDFF